MTKPLFDLAYLKVILVLDLPPPIDLAGSAT